MAPFQAIFCVALIINAVATFRSSSYWNKYKHLFGFSEPTGGQSTENSAPLLDESSGDGEAKAKHNAIMKKYLAVYLLAVFSDWLQGPYVYALYDSYGYSQHSIAVLFVAGFGSSMVFGTFMGGLADAGGRKKFTIFFAIIYALSCLTKHFKDFKVLMLGRLLGGVATSLLFSVFDSWLIKSHAAQGCSSYLSNAFATAQYGNSIIAIMAGLMANHAAEITKLEPVNEVVNQNDGDAVLYMGGYLNPFDMAFVALVVCGVLAMVLWDENYGEEKQNKHEDSFNQNDENDRDAKKATRWYDAFTNAFFTTINSKEILYTGLICSLFEGSMYIFVFMWTPAMKAKTTGDIPFGLVFATFMVGCMAGSSIFSVLITKMKNEKIGIIAFGIATGTFILMALAPTDTLAMVAFLLFELTVGIYFPMMGTMKSGIVPESKRTAIYNLYRIPLNFIVLFSLLTDLSPKQSFGLCTVMMGTALLLQTKLVEHQRTFYKASASTSASGDGKGVDLESGTVVKAVVQDQKQSEVYVHPTSSGSGLSDEDSETASLVGAKAD